MSKTYRTKAGLVQFLCPLSLVLADDNDGHCLACGNVQSAEPDARKYVCHDCGKPKVYGTQELALMNLVYDDESEYETPDDSPKLEGDDELGYHGRL